jgi:hypothetical protein
MAAVARASRRGSTVASSRATRSAIAQQGGAAPPQPPTVYELLSSSDEDGGDDDSGEHGAHRLPAAESFMSTKHISFVIPDKHMQGRVITTYCRRGLHM